MVNIHSVLSIILDLRWLKKQKPHYLWVASWNELSNRGDWADGNTDSLEVTSASIGMPWVKGAATGDGQLCLQAAVGRAFTGLQQTTDNVLKSVVLLLFVLSVNSQIIQGQLADAIFLDKWNILTKLLKKYAVVDTEICEGFFLYFEIYRGRSSISASWLPRWPQQPGLGHADARSGQWCQPLGLSALSSALLGSWIRKTAALCQHCRWWLYLLCHSFIFVASIFWLCFEFHFLLKEIKNSSGVIIIIIE